jgi:hypothetical protein
VLIEVERRGVEFEVGGSFLITGPILLPLLELLDAGTLLLNGRFVLFVVVDEF